MVSVVVNFTNGLTIYLSINAYSCSPIREALGKALLGVHLGRVCACKQALQELCKPICETFRNSLIAIISSYVRMALISLNREHRVSSQTIISAH